MSIESNDFVRQPNSKEKGKKFSQRPKKLPHSAKSILRLLTLLHSLNPPYRFYHQTLTFAGKPSDEVAKSKLDKFLKQLLKRFPKLAVIWVRERQKKGARHFHLMLLFFKQEGEAGEVLPFKEDRMTFEFGSVVFEIWSRLNNGAVKRDANHIVHHEFNEETVNYLLKSVRVAKTGTGLTYDRWWGKANARVLKENAREFSRKEVCEDFRRLFGKKRRPPLSSTERSRIYRERKKQEIFNLA